MYVCMKPLEAFGSPSVIGALQNPFQPLEALQSTPVSIAKKDWIVRMCMGKEFSL